MSDDELIGEILRREGWPKYTEHPADRGGPTKGGITLAAWREFMRNPAATALELQGIGEEQARTFYRHKHITGPRFDAITDARLRELVVDAGVNHGTGLAARWIQRAAHVTADGIIGPISIDAINSRHSGALFLRVAAARIRLFGELVTRDPRRREAQAAGFRLQAENAAGWNARAAEFLEAEADRLEAAHARG